MTIRDVSALFSFANAVYDEVDLFSCQDAEPAAGYSNNMIATGLLVIVQKFDLQS